MPTITLNGTALTPSAIEGVTPDVLSAQFQVPDLSGFLISSITLSAHVDVADVFQSDVNLVLETVAWDGTQLYSGTPGGAPTTYAISQALLSPDFLHTLTFVEANGSGRPGTGDSPIQEGFTLADFTLSPATVTITFSGTVPITADDSAVATPGVGGTASADAAHGVLANDRDPYFNYALSVSGVSGANGAGTVGQQLAGAHGLLTLNADGSYNYVVTNLTGATGGHLTDQFTYTASDGHGGTTPGTLTISLDRAPFSTVQTATSLAGNGISRTVLLSDPDGDPVRISAVNGAAANLGVSVAGQYGELNLHADGSYTYVANQTAAIAAATNPVDTFTYTAVDQFGATATETLNINIGSSAPGSGVRSVGSEADLVAALQFANLSATPVEIVFTNNITLDAADGGNLPAVTLIGGGPLTIDGGGFVLDGAGAYRGLFVSAGNVTVQNLTIQHAVAQGDDGGGSAGGGAGLGGGLFVGPTATVTLENVNFQNNASHGGAGGNAYGGFSSTFAPGPGGSMPGLEGNAGASPTGTAGPGQAGSAGGSGGFGGGGGAGGTGGLNNGVVNQFNVTIGGSGGAGGAGGFGGGGGAGGIGGFAATFPGEVNAGGTGGTGGTGGFGGGGGGGGQGGDGNNNNQNPEGFGGLGGAAGAGGFGAGSGGAGGTPGPSTDGFEHDGALGGLPGGGGGGLGAGADVFVADGGQLIIGGGSLAAGAVTGGSGGSGTSDETYGQFISSSAGSAGTALGTAIFASGSAPVIAVAPLLGATLTVGGTIADQTGGAGANAGALAIHVNGPGTLTLTAANTYSGGTLVEGGTLQLGNGGAAGSIAGNVTDNAVFAIDHSDTYTFAGIVSGTGVLQQIGTGRTVLTAADAVAALITAGTLQLGNGSSDGSLSGSVTDNALFVDDDTGTNTLSGAISGSGSFQKSGTGTTILAAADGVATTISAGVLQIGTGSTDGSISGNVTNNATLSDDDAGTNTLSGTISGTGVFKQIGSGTTIITGADNYGGGTTITSGVLQLGNGGTSGSISGNITDNSVLAIDRSDTVTLNNAISGAGTLQQSGTGTTTLAAGETYAGGTVVTAGTLRLGHASSLLSGSSLTVNGGTFDLNDTNQIIGDLTGSGGAVALGNATLTAGTSSSTAFAGAISGTGLLFKVETGTLTLTGANSYSGGTVIQAGTLQIGNGGSAGSIAGIVLDNGALAIDRSDVFSFAASIGGNGTFNQIGTGTTILTAADSVLGGTTISAGALELGNGGSITGNVTFADLGNAETLRVDNGAGQLGGSIAGFAANDKVDLSFVGFDAALSAVWQENGGSTGGTLSLQKNGSTLATLNLAGLYVSGNFSLANDSHGGTLIGFQNPPDLVATLSSSSPVQGSPISVTAVTDGGSDVLADATFQWLVNGVNATGTGATSATYTPIESDEGKSLSVNVTYAADPDGSETTNDVAGSVAEFPGADEGVSITGLTNGNAVQGTAVTVTGVTDGGLAVSNITSYRWTRDGLSIANANSASYTPTEADEGHALAVTIGFTDPGNNVETFAASAGVVQDSNDTVVNFTGLTGGNAVQGTPVVITSVEDGIFQAQNVAYQWQRDGVNIPNATNLFYTPTEADEGHALTVNVSFTDSNNEAETGTGNAGTVQEIAGGDTAVTLSGLTAGNAVEGTAVTVSGVTDGGVGVGGATYQWQRDGVNIANATNATYTPTENDEGHTLAVNVSFNDSNGIAETGSASGGTVQENPAENAAISIAGLTGGNAVEGTQLTATVTEADAPASGITYSWKVNNVTVHSGVDSAGNTYTPVAADAAGQISVAVSFTDSHGFAETGSMSAGTVQGPPQPPQPPPDGTTADMITSQASTGNYEIYDLGKNAVLAADPLTNIAAPWQVVGLGGFNGSDTTDMMLRNSSTGAFEIVDVSNNNASAAVQIGAVGLRLAVAGFGDFSGRPGETDMLLRNSNTGEFVVYDISNNMVTSATSLGGVGLQKQVLGFGDFSGKANETDMLLRDSNTGMVDLYEISNNQVTSVTPLGGIGFQLQFAGAGDFSGRPGETDVLMRDSTNGNFVVYDFQNGKVTSATSMGGVGLSWTVAGFGDFSGNANETDMMMRTDTGAFMIYDISNNQVTAVHSIGGVGLTWQVAGIANDPPTSSGAPSTGAMAASDQVQSSSTSLAASDPPGAGGWLSQMMQMAQSGIGDWLTQAMQANGAANQPALAGAGFDAGSDPMTGTVSVSSLAVPNPLQAHTA